MNKKNLLILFTILSALALGACGGSSGGGGGGGGGPLATGGFIKTAIMGTGTAYGGHFPDAAPVDFHVMHLYDASQISGSGFINAISFKSNQASTGSTCNDITIKMGHTSQTPLVNTFITNIEQGKGKLETVLTNAQVIIPAVALDDYFTIQLDTPFNYNGVDNLVVDFIRTGVCSQTIGIQADSGLAAHSLWSINLLSGTGSLDAGLNMKLHFAGGDNEQTMGGTGSNLSPFGFSMPRMQSLYLASEINGSGPITGIAYQMNTTSAAGAYTFSLKMGHSTLSTLGLTYADNYSDTPVTVATNVTVNIPAGIPAGGWVWIPIPDGVFTYNGTDNLIVDIDKTVGTANNNARVATVTGRRAEGSSGALVAANVDSAYYHLKFRFNGSTIGVITDAVSGTSNAFPGNGIGGIGGRMNLYRASELGTAAKITSVACRLEAATSTATTLNNYKVIMCHTLLESIDAIAANNFISQQVVYDMPFNIPAGLVQGDWITVPLTTPFNYNGTDNLVIWMGTTAASGGITHRCELSSTDARFPNHSGTGPPDSINITGIGNEKFDLRLEITK